MTNGRFPHVTVPAEQRRQLQAAIITLISVLLGILLTLSSQVVSQLMFPENPDVPTTDAAAFAYTVPAPDPPTLPPHTMHTPIYTTKPVTISGVITNTRLLILPPLASPGAAPTPQRGP